MPANTLTVAEVATRYGTTPHTVGAWIRSGELRAVNVSRSRTAKRPTWRIPPTAIEAFEAARAPQQQPAVKARKRKTNAEVIAFY